MANGVFTYAKGRFVEWSTLPAASDSIVVCLLKSSGLQADSTLQDYQTLSALLAASNDEADFTNYVRKILTGGITISVNTTTNVAAVQPGNFTWSAAGGALNNTIGKLITCYRPDSGSPDSDIRPMTYHDCTVTTTGSDLLISISGSNLATAS